MCSKCFKEAANKKENIKEQEELRIEESSNVRKHLRTPSPEPRDISSVTTPTPSTPSVTSTDSPKSDMDKGIDGITRRSSFSSLIESGNNNCPLHMDYI